MPAGHLSVCLVGQYHCESAAKNTLLCIGRSEAHQLWAALSSHNHARKPQTMSSVRQVWENGVSPPRNWAGLLGLGWTYSLENWATQALPPLGAKPLATNTECRHTATQFSQVSYRIGSPLAWLSQVMWPGASLFTNFSGHNGSCFTEPMSEARLGSPSSQAPQSSAPPPPLQQWPSQPASLSPALSSHLSPYLWDRSRSASPHY